jgi:hypothetical protein
VSRSLSVGVSAGESVGDGVGGFRLVFHPEIEAVKLACPLMLRDRREPLVQQELQAHPCVQGTPPQVWVPVAHCLNQAHELAFIGHQAGVMRSHMPAEERDSALSLM